MLRRLVYIVFSLIILTSLPVAGQVPGSRSAVDSLIASRGQATVYIKNPGREALDILTRNLSISGIRDGLVEIVLAPGDVDYFSSLGTPFYLFESEGSKISIICCYSG
ncbi:MAG: hypothetical protein R2744_06085 [Bacteroidales bacterium]